MSEKAQMTPMDWKPVVNAEGKNEYHGIGVSCSKFGIEFILVAKNGFDLEDLFMIIMEKECNMELAKKCLVKGRE